MFNIIILLWSGSVCRKWKSVHMRSVGISRVKSGPMSLRMDGWMMMTVLSVRFGAWW